MCEQSSFRPAMRSCRSHFRRVEAPTTFASIRAASDKLKNRAAENGRSLQTELKAILDRSAQEMSFKELRRRADEFSKRFEGRKFTVVWSCFAKIESDERLYRRRERRREVAPAGARSGFGKSAD